MSDIDLAVLRDAVADARKLSAWLKGLARLGDELDKLVSLTNAAQESEKRLDAAREAERKFGEDMAQRKADAEEALQQRWDGALAKAESDIAAKRVEAAAEIERERVAAHEDAVTRIEIAKTEASRLLSEKAIKARFAETETEVRNRVVEAERRAVEVETKLAERSAELEQIETETASLTSANAALRKEHADLTAKRDTVAVQLEQATRDYEAFYAKLPQRG